MVEDFVISIFNRVKKSVSLRGFNPYIADKTSDGGLPITFEMVMIDV
jgi:hypothetical protein